MQYRISILIILSAIIMSACGSDATKGGIPENDLKSDEIKTATLKDVALKVCDCLQPLVDINFKMEDLQIAGDTEGLQATFGALITTGTQTAKCHKMILKTYDVQLKNNEAKLIRLLKAECGDVGVNYTTIVESLNEQSGTESK